MTAQPQDTPLQSHEVSQLYAIFTALPTGVLLLDGEGRITRANPAAKALLGEPLEGQAWRQIIDRCFQPARMTATRFLCATGAGFSCRPSRCRISRASWCSSTI